MRKGRGDEERERRWREVMGKEGEGGGEGEIREMGQG